jgi:hypothetical protein
MDKLSIENFYREAIPHLRFHSSAHLISRERIEEPKTKSQEPKAKALAKS